MNKIEPGTYQHFKGGLYEVIGVGQHSETLEELVIYRSQKNNSFWVRPSAMFNELMDIQGKKVPRFKKAD